MLLNSDKVEFLVGSAETVEQMKEISTKDIFSKDIINFLNEISRIILKDPNGKKYSDVMTFGFWLRKGSTIKIKERYKINDRFIHIGRGIAFHIAPSNVPVNFAYSLAVGLLTGNANIVKIPSREYEQVEIIIEAIKRAIEYTPEIKPYIALIRYNRDKEINDYISSISDLRIIWGGDSTIYEIRKSPLPPRSVDITFADRYSLAVIDSDEYLDKENKEAIAQDFYNDTYFTDQNACTSPRIVIWVGNRKEEAKQLFWTQIHELVKKNYQFQPIQGVNKLTSGLLFAVSNSGAKILDHIDNLLIRVSVHEITETLMDKRDNCGYFFEYDCENILEIKPLCNKKCQTIGLLGDIEIIKPLLTGIVRGIDRVVPIGKTMDFDLVWDGYNLVSQLSRTIVI